MHLEEAKFDELFTFQYSYTYDPLKTLLKAVLDKLNTHQVQLLYFRDLADKLLKQSSFDKGLD